MYKATREFIKARQPYTKYPVQQIFGINKIGGGIENDCFHNSYNTIDRSKGIRIVSGWVIGPFDAINNCAPVLQHWWNVDSTGKYLDTSPNISNNFEYVIDMALAEYGMENFDVVSAVVTKNLMYRDGDFYRVDDLDKLIFTKLNNLITASLFSFD